MDIKELKSKRVRLAIEIQTIYNEYHNTALLAEHTRTQLEHEFKDKHNELKKINRRITLLDSAT